MRQGMMLGSQEKVMTAILITLLLPEPTPRGSLLFGMSCRYVEDSSICLLCPRLSFTF